MLLRPDQVSDLLDAATALGRPVPRLRQRLADSPQNDAHQAELVALIAALSVGDAVPELPEQGAQPPARPDVHCVLRDGHQLMIECLHVGADMTSNDWLRPPLFVAFDRRLREELTRCGVSGNTVSLSYPGVAGMRSRIPHRAQFDEVLASPGFLQFVDDLNRATDGRALWHVESHHLVIEANGYTTILIPGRLPPDLQDHPVYRGIKRKVSQAKKLAKPGIPVVLFCAVTNATPVVHGAAMRGVDSRLACLAAFGVPGEGQMIATADGIVTHGKIQGSERIAAVIVLEVSPRNYFPPHRTLTVFANPQANDPTSVVHDDALRHMLVLTHHATPVDAATLSRQILLRREAIAWNAKPLCDRVEQFRANQANEAGAECTTELGRLLAKGHTMSWPECWLHVWPFDEPVVRTGTRRASGR